jgi:hypothetical protein
MGHAKEVEEDSLYIIPHCPKTLLEIQHPVKTWTEEIGLKQFEEQQTEIQKSEIQHSETSEPEYLFRAPIPERYTMIRITEWSMIALRILQNLLSLICLRPVEASIVTVIWLVLMLITLAAKTDYPDQSSIPYVTITLACLVFYNIASSFTPKQWYDMFFAGLNEVSRATPGMNTWPTPPTSPPTSTPDPNKQGIDLQFKLENIKLAKLRAKSRANRQRKRGSQILMKEQAGAIANTIEKSFAQGLTKITETITLNVQRALVDPFARQLKNIEEELRRTSAARQAISQQEPSLVKADDGYTSYIAQLEKQNEKLSGENDRLTKEKDEALDAKLKLMKEKVKLMSDESLRTQSKKIQSHLEESNRNLEAEKQSTLSVKKELESVKTENKRISLLLKQTEDKLKTEEIRTKKEKKSLIEEKDKVSQLLKESNESLNAQKSKAEHDVDSLTRKQNDILKLLKAKTEELETEKATSKQYKEQLPKDKNNIVDEAKKYVNAQTLNAQNILAQKDRDSHLAVTTAQNEKKVELQNLTMQLENERRDHFKTKQANAALAKKQHQMDARRRKEKKHRARLTIKHKAAKRAANTLSSIVAHPSISSISSSSSPSSPSSSPQPETLKALTQDEGTEQGKMVEKSKGEEEGEEECEVLDILPMIDQLKEIWEHLDKSRDQGGKLATNILELLEQAEQAPPDAIPPDEKIALRKKVLEFLDDAAFWRSLSFENLDIRDTRNALLACMERVGHGRALRPTMPLKRRAQA